MLDHADDTELPLLVFPDEKKKLKEQLNKVIGYAYYKSFSDMFRTVENDIKKGDTQKALESLSLIEEEYQQHEKEYLWSELPIVMFSRCRYYTAAARRVQLNELAAVIEQLIENKKYYDAREKADELDIYISKLEYPEIAYEWEQKKRDLIISSEDARCAMIDGAINKCLSDNNLRRAELLLKDLEMNSPYAESRKNYWTARREELSKQIERRKRTENGTVNVKIPASSWSFKGDSYLEVEARLKDAGFTNITLKAHDDLILSIREGEVESIAVNGKEKFDKGDSFDYESSIIITYHTKG